MNENDENTQEPPVFFISSNDSFININEETNIIFKEQSIESCISSSNNNSSDEDEETTSELSYYETQNINNNMNKIENKQDEINQEQPATPTTCVLNEEIEIDSLMFRDNDNIKYEIIEDNMKSLEKSQEDPLLQEEEPIPNLIFIIPYRDREKEKDFFKKKMEEILTQKYSTTSIIYKIYFIHQVDKKPFNRGAIKNIGFMAIKNKYPNHYKNITLVFNDVDTTPLNSNTIPEYMTTENTVKHFYGYTFALGGIVSITAGDFEKINGFPNYYSWGFEDNELNERVLKNGMTIDRSTFYQIHDDNNIIQIQNSSERIVNRGEFERYARKIKEGIDTIYGLIYQTHTQTNNDYDNITTTTIHVHSFETVHKVNESLNEKYNIQNGNAPFKVGYSAKRRSRMNLVL
jgi:hypothetical protein